jgi:hypothetical protein
MDLQIYEVITLGRTMNNQDVQDIAKEICSTAMAVHANRIAERFATLASAINEELAQRQGDHG